MPTFVRYDRLNELPDKENCRNEIKPMHRCSSIYTANLRVWDTERTSRARARERAKGMKVHGRECTSERQREREREAEEACGLEAGSNAQERAGCVLIKR